MSLTLDICPGYEFTTARHREALSTPPEGGSVRVRQRNERVLRRFPLTWKKPSAGAFSVLMQLFRDAAGTTLPVTITLPAPDSTTVDACFDEIPKRVHGNAGSGESFSAVFVEVR